MKIRLLKFFLNIVRRFKPLIVRLFPRDFLREAKKRMMRIPAAEVAKTGIVPFRRENYADGVNLIGPLLSPTGLGQSCRLVAEMLESESVPLDLLEYNPLNVSNDNNNTDGAWVEKTVQEITHNINILHINAQELPLAYTQLGRDVWDGRYNIAYWLWESEEFPNEYLPILDMVDEIWAPSDFSGVAVKKHTCKPVLTMPLRLSELQVDPQYDRRYFNLPDDVFLFMCVYDSASVQARKNPQGAVAAFKMAFGVDHMTARMPNIKVSRFSEYDSKIGLVIKAGNAPEAEIEHLKKQLQGFSYIYIIEKPLSRIEMNSLLQCVDIYVSLHRAEGFGLVCAEAMSLGKPVIATNWSANTEFMDAASSCLVDYRLIALEQDCPPFPKGTRWADPDVGQAAGYMRRLCSDRGYYDAVGMNAREHIREALCAENTSVRMHRRVDEILSTGGTLR